MPINFQKVFQVEQCMANELIAVAHEEIREENRIIRDFREGVADNLTDVSFVVGKEELTDKQSITVSATALGDYWAKAVDFHNEKYVMPWLKDNIRATKDFWKIFSDGLVELQKNQVTEAKEVVPGLAMKLFKVDEKNIEKFWIRKWTKDGKTWIERLEEIKKGASKDFEKIFKKGFREGKGYAEMLRQAKKKIAKDAVRLERIIRTEGQRIQNDIAMMTYHKNQEYLSGLEFTAALDRRTCEVCGAYDRNQYWYRREPHVVDAPVVPIHPLCRCVYAPISRLWERLGTDWPKERWSRFGPTTKAYPDWLKDMEAMKPGFAQNILKKNYGAWLEGEYVLDAALIKFTLQATIADYLKREGFKARKAKAILPVKTIEKD